MGSWRLSAARPRAAASISRRAWGASPCGSPRACAGSRAAISLTGCSFAFARTRNVDPVRLRSDRLPFRDGSFDLAVCLGLLEHLPPDVRRQTMAELRRVLRPGGLLGVVLNNDESALLRDPGDNPHRVGAQRENGYYCAVVTSAELLREAASSFEDRILGSNLLYSLQRHASRALPDASRRDRRLTPFFERAAAFDRALRPMGPMADQAADHHLHLFVRR
jgi:SAM-dependent methyltransferase